MPTSSQLNVLVLTNMYPSETTPARGRFVADQVTALRRLGGVSVEVFAFSADGSALSYLTAARTARRRYGGQHFDVVHAHFGLSAWPALAVPAGAHAVTLHGTDLGHPRSRAITLAALPWLDLVGVASAELGTAVPAWAARDGVRELPCGVDLHRFRALPRAEARTALGLDPHGRYVLFPADPGRPEKRADLARALIAAVRERVAPAGPGGAQPAADAAAVTLLSLGEVPPERVPLYVNAADAVVIPSDREGFGLACLEALACDVPVLSTPHGIAREVLGGVDGCLCAEFSLPLWTDALSAVLSLADPRIRGRAAAAALSAEAMAERMLEAWRGLAAASLDPGQLHEHP